MNKKCLLYICGLALASFGLQVPKNHLIVDFDVPQISDIQKQAYALLPRKNVESWTKDDSLGYLNGVLDTWAASTMVGKEEMLLKSDNSMWKQLLNRDLGELWYQYHYVQKFGYFDAQIQKYFLNNKLGTLEDYNALAPLNAELWAQEMFLNSQNVFEFYNKHKFEWKKPRQYLISVIANNIANENRINQNLNRISFEEVAKNWSTDSSSASQGGLVGWYYQGVEPGVLGAFSQWVYDTLFDQVNVKNKLYVKKKDSLVFWIKVVDFKNEEIPPFDSVENYAKFQIVQNYKSNIFDSTKNSLSKKYSAKILNLPYPDPVDFYQQNMKDFYSPIARRFLVLESEDSLSLARIVVNDSKSFKLSNIKKINNKYIKNCDLGWVNDGWGLPYDLGNPEGLDAELRTMSVHQKSSVYKVPGKTSFMVLWLDSLRPAQPKPYERVKNLVFNAMRSKAFVFADSTPLIKIGDSVVLREDAYQTLFKSLPDRQKMQINRYDILNQILWSNLIYLNAKENEFDQTSLGQLRLKYTMNMLIVDFFKSKQQKYLQQSQRRVDSILLIKKNYFPESNKGGVEAASLYLEMPKVIIDIAWSKYLDSLGLKMRPMESKYFDSLFIKLFPIEFKLAKERQLFLRKVQLWGKDSIGQNVFGLFDNINDYINRFPHLAHLDPKAKATILSKALNAFVGQNGWQQLAYESAKALADILKIDESIRTLDMIIFSSDKSNLADKALFMKGYLQMDQLRNDTLALKTFGRLVRDYPKSPLADDADFLIRDLQSGRKLSQELLHKLESK